jgi:hypothetical protein
MNDEHAHDPVAPGGDHDAWRELLALALYDELDAGEAARLQAHLAGCADCRAERRALSAGLGAVRPAGPAAAAAGDGADVPADWSRRLEAALRDETAVAPPRPAPPCPPPIPAPRLPFARGALLAAAGFAAGLLVATALAAPDTGAPAARAPVAPGPTAFSLAEPPPPPLPRAPRPVPEIGLLFAR